jgi:hypothetical protein
LSSLLPLSNLDVSLLRLRKDILEISQSGGKILSREISFNDERRSVDADDRKWSDHKDRREREKKLE